MKLHVGCGERYLPGWKHLDARKFPHVDYVTNKLDKLDMYRILKLSWKNIFLTKISISCRDFFTAEANTMHMISIIKLTISSDCLTF